jgi:DNA-binding NarL/FixJ family response regulator
LDNTKVSNEKTHEEVKEKKPYNTPSLRRLSDPSVRSKLDALARRVHPQRTLLTSREVEIVRLVAEGKSNKDMASMLAISVRTIETHRSRLMLKLQVRSIAHLIQYAIKNHVITL